MDIPQLEEIFYKAKSGLGIHPESVNEKTKVFFAKYKVPDQLASFLSHFSYNEAIKVNRVHFGKLNNISEVNLFEENKYCISNGYLIIGFGLNGDPVVINTTTMEVGYVYHDKLWETDRQETERLIVNLGVTVSEFYHYSSGNDDYPVDAYEAEEYLEKKKLI